MSGKDKDIFEKSRKMLEKEFKLLEIIETSQKRRLNLPWVPITIFALLVLAISAGLNWRAEAVKQYPPIAILYDAVGLHVPVKGENLVLKNIGAWRNNEQFMEILLVQGAVSYTHLTLPTKRIV